MIGAPSSCIPVINSRLDLVDLFMMDKSLPSKLKLLLSTFFKNDATRAIQALKYGKGGPWHLGVLHQALCGAESIRHLLLDDAYSTSVLLSNTTHLLSQLRHNLDTTAKLKMLLHSVLPLEFTDGTISLGELPKSVDHLGVIRAEFEPLCFQMSLIHLHLVYRFNKDLMDIVACHNELNASKIEFLSLIQKKCLNVVGADACDRLSRL